MTYGQQGGQPMSDDLQNRATNHPSGGGTLRERRQLHMSPGELAEYWSVHPNTIYRDIRKGALRAFRLPGGYLRIRTSDAVKYGRPTE
jgi:excisionase family DNA binding protein